MSVLVDSYSETNHDFTIAIDGHDPGGVNAIGQTFVGNGCTLNSAKFYVAKIGAPTGNATAKLYAITGTPGSNATPTGAALTTSANVDISTLSTSLSLITFSFDSTFTLVNGTNYAITAEFSGGSSGNSLSVGCDNSSPTHNGNGAKFGVTSNTWAPITPDVCFYVYADTISGVSPIAISIPGIAISKLRTVTTY